MEAAIRFSQNSIGGNDQRFISADVTNRTFKLCKIEDIPSSSTFTPLKYQTVASATKVPSFRAFDWHPHPNFEHIVAVGQSNGEATVLGLTSGDGHEYSPVSFPSKNPRSCNAVSLSSVHLLAAGLERVRTDTCLHVFDFSQRLPLLQSNQSGPRSSTSKTVVEPLHKLSPNDSITSLKFFPTSPQHLVAGSKSGLVKLFDLREANSASNAGLQFSTRCIHNLAIDWQDENFFASCFPNGEDASISLWDRRMASRLNATQSPYSSKQPEACLEISNIVNVSASIWSLRFSKSKRGCLGMLSSDGRLKMFEMSKDMAVEEYRVHEEGEDYWEAQLPQDTVLKSSQDVEKSATELGDMSGGLQVVSFDFTTRQDIRGQPCLIALMNNGKVVSAAPTPAPQPTLYHSCGILYGMEFFEPAVKKGDSEEVSARLQAIKSKAKPQETRPQARNQARKDGTIKSAKGSSFENQSWQADLGYYNTNATVSDLLSLQNTAKLRCTNGYCLDPSLSKTLVTENSWLQGFWEYVERACQFNDSDTLVEDNFDLAHLGIYSIWMEDMPFADFAVRNIGSSKVANSVRFSKTIEALAKRLQLPALEHVVTEYSCHRQLCLHLSNVSWNSKELEQWVNNLIAQGQHSKAAFLALLSGEDKMAKQCLLHKKINKDQRVLALAVTSAMKRKTDVSTGQILDSDNSKDGNGEDNDDDDELWISAINNALSTTTETYARAILTYVKEKSWNAVLQTQTAIPLKYRLAIALRRLDDSALTKYISETTSAAIENGDIEGVHLTGIGTAKAFDLLQKYVYRFNDLQTSVLALCFTIPRYMLDPKIRRKFDAWKKQYRNDIMSWGGDSKFDRVAFDVQAAQLAIDNVTGESLFKPPPPQIRLVCTYCNSGLAHHERGYEDSQTESNTTTHNTKGNPLAPATAAAKGIVCPQCGRGMPNCGVCDLPLGQEDTSFMKWHDTSDSVEPGASERLAGSIGTIVGNEKEEKAQNMSKTTEEGQGEPSRHDKSGGLDSGNEELEAELERIRNEDATMARFTVICTKCDHGFHYRHARMWFYGDLETGTQPHQICPVPECQCSCYKHM